MSEQAGPDYDTWTWPKLSSYKALDELLDELRNEIRLLDLHGYDYASGTVRASLRHVSLDDDPEYVALSYCWGPPIPERKVDVNSESATIRPNLHGLLVALCERNGSNTFWLDALCINQGDNEEKSSQVAKMADIYTRAKCVIAWLGPINAEVDPSIS